VSYIQGKRDSFYVAGCFLQFSGHCSQAYSSVAILAGHSVVAVIDNDSLLNQETNEPWRHKNNHTG